LVEQGHHKKEDPHRPGNVGAFLWQIAVLQHSASNLNKAHVTRDSIGSATWATNVQRAIK